MAGIEVLLQSSQIGDETARKVNENRVLLHVGELVFAEESGVRLAAIHVQGHGIGLFQQFVEGVATVGIAQCQFLLNVVEHHAHAEGLGQYRQLGADVAVADDAEGLASHFMRTGSGLVPQAMLDVMRVCGNAAHQADDVADHQFHHGTGVGVGSVEHGDATLAGMCQIDLIGADAEAADGA